jgi:hypothetical protein
VRGWLGLVITPAAITRHAGNPKVFNRRQATFGPRDYMIQCYLIERNRIQADLAHQPITLDHLLPDGL